MKTYRLFLAAAFLVSLTYGFTIGAGVQLYDVLEEDPAFSVYADASVPILPILHWRQGIFNLDLPSDNMSLSLGTGLSSDLLFFIPANIPITPYVVTGLWTYLSDTGIELDLRVGLGGQTDIGPVFGYLELGTDFSLIKPDEGDTQTDFPLFVRAGIRRPLKFKIKR